MAAGIYALTVCSRPQKYVEITRHDAVLQCLFGWSGMANREIPRACEWIAAGKRDRRADRVDQSFANAGEFESEIPQGVIWIETLRLLFPSLVSTTTLPSSLLAMMK